MLKRLLSWSIDHAVNRKQFGNYLAEFAMIKEKFGRMSANIYAMESMAYLTAGILDGQEDPDCSVEAAIVKVRQCYFIVGCTKAVLRFSTFGYSISML